MGNYDHIPVIEGRYDAYGRKTYWAQGYEGQGIKVGVCDEFGTKHGPWMANHDYYIAKKAESVRLNMTSNSAQALERSILEGIEKGVHILSISRGVPYHVDYLHKAIKKAYDAGILIFASAGNDGEKYADTVSIENYPASYPETISVLCLNNTLAPSPLSSHSNTGTITGWGQNVLVRNDDGTEQLVSGTSPTTAAYAFTAALYMSRYLHENGKAPTVQYMHEFIRNNCVDMWTVGKDNMTGYGFFTLDKDEYERVRLMMLDSDRNGLSDRIDRIKALTKGGMDYDQAMRQVNSEYYIVEYERTEGKLVPIYGGRKDNV